MAPVTTVKKRGTLSATLPPPVRADKAVEVTVTGDTLTPTGGSAARGEEGHGSNLRGRSVVLEVRVSPLDRQPRADFQGQLGCTERARRGVPEGVSRLTNNFGARATTLHQS